MTRFAAVAVALVLSLPLIAQQSKNPVSDTVRDMMTRQSKNLVAAAEEMPAEKYSYKPTEQQMTFGHLVEHSAGGNYEFCSAIGGTPAPSEKVTEKDGKDKLVAALKQSFDFCNTALSKVEDPKLGDEVDLFGKKAPRAAALIRLATSWADHYGAAAIYLRLNGLLPPTAKK